MRRTLKRGERTIIAANGVETYAEALGDFPLILHGGFKLQLNNALYVPSMKRNLVSVSCLDDNGYVCQFLDGSVIALPSKYVDLPEKFQRTTKTTARWEGSFEAAGHGTSAGPA